MEPTSQQELKQLLDDGKISEREYQELIQAMAEQNKKRPVIPPPIKPAGQNSDTCKNNSGGSLGLIAFILVLGGFIIPALGYLFFDFVTGPNKKPELMPFLFLFGAMELAGFMTGVVSWKDRFGKAAAITGAILLLSSIFFIA